MLPRELILNAIGFLQSKEGIVNADQARFVDNAVQEALNFIHGPGVNDLQIIDMPDLFDENWVLNFHRIYDRDDVQKWRVSVGVVPGPDELCTTKNSVSATASSYRNASFAALLYAALLFESMGDDNGSSASVAA